MKVQQCPCPLCRMQFVLERGDSEVWKTWGQLGSAVLGCGLERRRYRCGISVGPLLVRTTSCGSHNTPLTVCPLVPARSSGATLTCLCGQEFPHKEMLCSVVLGYHQRLGWPYCLHLHFTLVPRNDLFISVGPESGQQPMKVLVPTGWTNRLRSPAEAGNSYVHYHN
jgi:hypothetical protein